MHQEPQADRDPDVAQLAPAAAGEQPGAQDESGRGHRRPRGRAEPRGQGTLPPSQHRQGDAGLTATGLVLLMTPGLSFFYGGMVRTKNVVSTMLQSFVAMAVISFEIEASVSA